jgi:anti-anti-sigma factor
MEIKIDTKEKFKVITPFSTTIDDNITKQINDLCLSIFENEKISVIIKLNQVQKISDFGIETLQNLSTTFYEKNRSFVLCELSPTVLKHLNEDDLLDNFNYAPTESEAWDIVQLEEIERELFSDDE